MRKIDPAELIRQQREQIERKVQSEAPAAVAKAALAVVAAKASAPAQKKNFFEDLPTPVDATQNLITEIQKRRQGLRDSFGTESVQFKQEFARRGVAGGMSWYDKNIANASPQDRWFFKQLLHAKTNDGRLVPNREQLEVMRDIVKSENPNLRRLAAQGIEAFKSTRPAEMMTNPPAAQTVKGSITGRNENAFQEAYRKFGYWLNETEYGTQPTSTYGSELNGPSSLRIQDDIEERWAKNIKPITDFYTGISFKPLSLIFDTSKAEEVASNLTAGTLAAITNTPRRLVAELEGAFDQTRSRVDRMSAASQVIVELTGIGIVGDLGRLTKSARGVAGLKELAEEGVAKGAISDPIYKKILEFADRVDDELADKVIKQIKENKANALIYAQTEEGLQAADNKIMKAAREGFGRVKDPEGNDVFYNPATKEKVTADEMDARLARKPVEDAVEANGDAPIEAPTAEVLDSDVDLDAILANARQTSLGRNLDEVASRAKERLAQLEAERLSGTRLGAGIDPRVFEETYYKALIFVAETGADVTEAVARFAREAGLGQEQEQKIADAVRAETQRLSETSGTPVMRPRIDDPFVQIEKSPMAQAQIRESEAEIAHRIRTSKHLPDYVREQLEALERGEDTKIESIAKLWTMVDEQNQIMGELQATQRLLPTLDGMEREAARAKIDALGADYITARNLVFTDQSETGLKLRSFQDLAAINDPEVAATMAEVRSRGIGRKPLNQGQLDEIRLNVGQGEHQIDIQRVGIKKSAKNLDGADTEDAASLGARELEDEIANVEKVYGDVSIRTREVDVITTRLSRRLKALQERLSDARRENRNASARQESRVRRIPVVEQKYREVIRELEDLKAEEKVFDEMRQNLSAANKEARRIKARDIEGRMDDLLNKIHDTELEVVKLSEDEAIYKSVRGELRTITKERNSLKNRRLRQRTDEARSLHSMVLKEVDELRDDLGVWEGTRAQLTEWRKELRKLKAKRDRLQRTLDKGGRNARAEERKLREDISGLLDEINKPKWWQEMLAIRKGALLANPRTLVRNLGGNSLQVVTDTALNPLNGFFDTIIRATHSTESQVPLFTGRASYVKWKDRVGTEWSRIWNGELNQGELDKIDISQSSKKRLSHYLMSAQSSLDLPFRAYMYEKSLNGYAKGLARQEWDALTQSQRAGLDQRKWSAARVEELTSEPTKEMKVLAQYDSNYAAFATDNRFADIIQDVKRKSELAEVVIEALLPFVRTPSNIASDIVTSNPVGMVGNVLRHRKRWRGNKSGMESVPMLDDAGKEVKDELGNVVYEQVRSADAILSDVDRKHLARMLSKGTLGTGLLMLGFFAAKRPVEFLGATFQLTGATAPSDKQRRDTLYAIGERPLSMTITMPGYEPQNFGVGGTHPLLNIMGLGATAWDGFESAQMDDMAEVSKIQEDTGEEVPRDPMAGTMNSAFAALTVLSEQPMFTAAKDLGRLDSPTGLKGLAENLISSFIPPIIGDARAAMGVDPYLLTQYPDPDMRREDARVRAGNFFGGLFAERTGLGSGRAGVFPRVDALGQPVTKKTGVGVFDITFSKTTNQSRAAEVIREYNINVGTTSAFKEMESYEQFMAHMLRGRYLADLIAGSESKFQNYRENGEYHKIQKEVSSLKSKATKFARKELERAAQARGLDYSKYIQAVDEMLEEDTGMGASEPSDMAPVRLDSRRLPPATRQ